MSGLIQHFLLTLRLNLRSKQALVYGYLVPIFFLLAFGSVFRSSVPPLLHEMGQLLTISILGGACFGMPTAMVAERERGVWRRYRLLPSSTGGLLASTMAARFVIIASAGVLQILLARVVYATPLPHHPIDLLIAFTFVTFSFLGMGLVIAALAENVPAVQALGQTIFLPMIMIGGVGVPLAALPAWVQKVAGFLPGRYAVEAMQPCFTGTRGGGGTGFALVALTVIGLAACIAGVKLFRWDKARHIGRSAVVWIGLAFFSWLAVGATAWSTGRLKPVVIPPTEPLQSITSAQIDGITYEGLTADDDTVTPMAPTVDGVQGEDKQRLATFISSLQTWPPTSVPSLGQCVRNLLSAASIADITQDPLEGRTARAVFDYLQANYEPEELKQALAWIIFHPQEGTVITSAPDLGLQGVVTEDVIRDRNALYAKKFLGRLVGKLPN